MLNKNIIGIFLFVCILFCSSGSVFAAEETADGSIAYKTQIENIGWQSFVYDGAMSGTEGQGLRLEAIKINLDEFDDEDLGVSYSTQIQNIGWSDAVSDGEMSGTEGQGLRLEAIKIELTGTDADKYDIYYTTHVQNVGWMSWASNGEASGSSGYGYRLEGIKIVVVDKGEDPPTITTDTEKTFKEGVIVEYEVHSIILKSFMIDVGDLIPTNQILYGELASVMIYGERSTWDIDHMFLGWYPYNNETQTYEHTQFNFNLPVTGYTHLKGLFDYFVF